MRGRPRASTVVMHTRSSRESTARGGRLDFGMLLLGMILFGMLIGAAAQLIVGRSARGVDWGRALVAGIVGSFIGGLLISLISGDGLALRPSGILGSLARRDHRDARLAMVALTSSRAEAVAAGVL